MICIGECSIVGIVFRSARSCDVDEDFGRGFFVHHTASKHQFRRWLSSAMEWAGLRCNRDVEVGSALDHEFMRSW